jgi:hypothetical protein
MGSVMDRGLIVKLVCVAAVAAIMLPFGNLAFPLVSDLLSAPQFFTIEAIVGASLGFGISAAIA